MNDLTGWPGSYLQSLAAISQPTPTWRGEGNSNSWSGWCRSKAHIKGTAIRAWERSHLPFHSCDKSSGDAKPSQLQCGPLRTLVTGTEPWSWGWEVGREGTEDSELTKFLTGDLAMAFLKPPGQFFAWLNESISLITQSSSSRSLDMILVFKCLCYCVLNQSAIAKSKE